jgi:hypothetical protein
LRAARNRLLADLFHNLLENAAHETIYSQEAVPTVYALLPDKGGYPELWRTIEIQGKQSLADLDLALRGAFNHDAGDHLGGFWKLVPRGGPSKLGSKLWRAGAAARRSGSPQGRHKYPREVGRNEPQYADCVECRQ